MRPIPNLSINCPFTSSVKNYLHLMTKKPNRKLLTSDHQRYTGADQKAINVENNLDGANRE